MIMPRMNSASACDAGGKVPVVEAGSFRVGLPGAPGWTTTGAGCAAPGPPDCATSGPPEIRIKPQTTKRAFTDRTFKKKCGQERSWGRRQGTLRSIFVLDSLKAC